MATDATAGRKVVYVEVREVEDRAYPCDVCRALLRRAITPRAKELPLEFDAKTFTKDGKLFIDQDRVHYARCKRGKPPVAASTAEEKVRQLELQLKDVRELLDESVSLRRFRQVSGDLSTAQQQVQAQTYRNRCLREVIDEARRRLSAGEANTVVAKWIDQALQLAERGLSPLGTTQGGTR